MAFMQEAVRAEALLLAEPPIDYQLPANVIVSSGADQYDYHAIRKTCFNLGFPLEELEALYIIPKQGIADIEAYTDVSKQTIYYADTLQPDELPAILGHEIGHVVDSQLLTSASREEYCRQRGITACDSWYSSTYHLYTEQDTYTDWQASPAEDFAEEFVRQYLDASYANHTQYGNAANLGAFWEQIYSIR
ncbi:MAG TPA: M48 family metalloprotease [bacterium]|nr:M48 family metalloprotease [bacterium]